MPEADPGVDRPRRWRDSLYARAALFLILGSGSFIGAVMALLTVEVDDSVERLLAERLELAHSAGAFIEQRLQAELDHLASRVQPLMAADVPLSELRSALAHEYSGSLFSEGAFLLDERGEVRTGVPRILPELEEALDLKTLARACDPLAVSEQVSLGQRPLLVLLRKLDRPHKGFVGGLLQPASVNLLDPLSNLGRPVLTELDLVDRRGRVVASTRDVELFRVKDHDNVLADAILEGRSIRGRCHNCHTDQSQYAKPDTNVLAFAPLPTLKLGVSVLQPEREALAPAFDLRRRMLWLGSSFVLLFLVFAGLSVRAVVLPVTELTRAARRAEGSGERLDLKPHGDDEVGQLAKALDLWRDRMVDSMVAQQTEHKRRTRQRLYLHRILRAQEDERHRIARELHDSLAQDLAALRLELERLSKRVRTAQARGWIAALEERAQDMMAQLRRILMDLRSLDLQNMGFLPALEWMVKRDPRLAGLRGTFVVDGSEFELGQELAVTMYRIVQEALLNVVQHAKAEQYFVTVSFEHDRVELCVEDDGVGFDPERFRPGRVGELGRGLGLLGMEERASLLGGQLHIQSGTGEGTVIRAVFPVAPAARGEREAG
jgi:signal transduction histidine kinase